MKKEGPKPIPTPQVKSLEQALRKLGLDPIVEHWDGFKHVDIALLKPKIYIEVDGLHHETDAQKILSDFKRDHYSDGDDFSTLRIPNQIVENYCDKVAHAVAEVAKVRMIKT